MSRIPSLFMIFSVILLVQQFYDCNCENHPSHRFLLSNIKILIELPNENSLKFQIIKYPKCLFSNQLVHYIFDQTSRRANLLLSSKAISQLKLTVFVGFILHFKEIMHAPLSIRGRLFSFPSSDKAKDAF